MLSGEAFVIENYMGLGTFPHRGISFTDATGANTRVFFFGENHAYPEPVARAKNRRAYPINFFPIKRRAEYGRKGFVIRFKRC